MYSRTLRGILNKRSHARQPARTLGTTGARKIKLFDQNEMAEYRESHAASSDVSAVDLVMSLIKPSDFEESAALMVDPEGQGYQGSDGAALKGWTSTVPDVNESRSLVRTATLLQSMVQQRRYMEAVMFYNKKLKEGLRPNLEILKLRLAAACYSGDIMIMGRIERQLVRYGVVPDAAFFDKWVEGAVLHDPNSVGSITGVMAKYGFKLSADSFTGIIRGFATTGLYARAVAAYHLMKESGIEPTATIYASMVIIWTNMGQTEKAGEYFYEMKERFPMGREQYNAGILYYRKTGQHELAMELVKEMQANKIRGDAMLYEGLATLLSKSNRSQEAVDILSKNSKKFTATLRTYNAMITVYGKHIGLKAAVEKFEELKRRFVPDVHTLSALLTTCTKLDPEVDTISQALAFIEEFRVQHDVKIEARQIFLLLRCCEEAAKLNKYNKERAMHHAWQVFDMYFHDPVFATPPAWLALINTLEEAEAVERIDATDMRVYLTNNTVTLEGMRPDELAMQTGGGPDALKVSEYTRLNSENFDTLYQKVMYERRKWA